MNVNLFTLVILARIVKEILSKFCNPVSNKYLPKKSKQIYENKHIYGIICIVVQCKSEAL